MEVINASMSVEGKRIAVIVSKWNELVTKLLTDGATETLAAHGAPSVVVFHVPGAWEIPLLAADLIHRKEVDGIVALGCILQGQTNHADLLSGDVSSTLMKLQVETRIPIGWGILVPENTEQALDRAGMKLGNKGREAALAVIEMVSLLSR